MFSSYRFHRPESLDSWLRRVVDLQYGDGLEDELQAILDRQRDGS